MKRLTQYKKVLGLAITDRTLLAAEVVAGDRPQIKRLAEMQYPADISTAQPAELGKALKEFLRSNDFTARATVIGIPVKWLVVKQKEVPAADERTVTDILRLQAETEFPSDLKDLVYDYAGDEQTAGVDGTKSVMLMATQRKYVESSTALCEAAGLRAIAVTPSVLALGEATGQAMDRNVLVLSVSPAGSELTAQRGGTTSTIRHIRAPDPQPPFVSELRRAVSTLGKASEDREMVLWDGAGVDTESLGDQLGFPVRAAELQTLGVDASATGMNGQGSKFAAAIAVALVGMSGPSVDFLHSRLAPPKQHSLQRKIAMAAAIALVVIGTVAYAYVNLQQKQKALADLQAQYSQMGDSISDAHTFVNRADFAKYWHGDNPLLLSCLRDLTNAIPDDGQTYATALDLVADTPHMPPDASKLPANVPHTQAKVQALRPLNVKLTGHTSNPENVTTIEEHMRNNPAFADIKIGQENRTGRNAEWSFSITFTYSPQSPTTAPAKK